MALKLHFAALSLGASVDQQTGNLSVFDILEEIRSPQLPIHLQQLVISLSLEKKETTSFNGKIFIHLFTPDGKQNLLGNGEMHIPIEQKRMKAVFRFGGFPVLAWGTHRFVLSWMNDRGQKVGEALLDFDVIQAQQVAQGVAPEGGSSIQH